MIHIPRVEGHGSLGKASISLTTVRYLLYFEDELRNWSATDLLTMHAS